MKGFLFCAAVAALSGSLLGADISYFPNVQVATNLTAKTGAFTSSLTLGGNSVLTNAQPPSATLTNLSTNTITGTGRIVLESAVTSGGSTNLTDSGTNVLSKGDILANALTATNGVFVKPSGLSLVFDAPQSTTGFKIYSRNDAAGFLYCTSGDSTFLFSGDYNQFSIPDRLVIGSAADVKLNRDAANTLALRNGTAAQAFKAANTWATGGTDFEYGIFDWIATPNSLSIGTTKGGTGVARNVQFVEGGTNIFYIDASTGALLWNTDNSRDIGASGANRPRSIYASSTVSALSQFILESSSSKLWVRNQSSLRSPSDGVWTMLNNAENDFNRLQFGGTTASFPSIKRNGAGLESRLADDSNYAPLNAPWQQSGYTKVCTSAVSNALFYVSVPNTNMIGGRVLYTVSSTDGTDAQQITGTCQFGAVGKSTAVTANITDVQNTSTVSAGTLTAVLTANVSTNNVFALMVTPTTSLTTTNLVIKWRLETPSTYTVNAL